MHRVRAKLTRAVQQDVENVMVVVTRWYGGIHLGADRFKDINSVRFHSLAPAERPLTRELFPIGCTRCITTRWVFRRGGKGQREERECEKEVRGKARRVGRLRDTTLPSLEADESFGASLHTSVTCSSGSAHALAAKQHRAISASSCEGPLQLLVALDSLQPLPFTSIGQKGPSE